MQQDTRHILFIDLDHTLLDNLDLRLSALRPVLKFMFPEPALAQALSSYSSIIDHTYAFETLGFSSFSHYWNPIEIYAILALLARDSHFLAAHPEIVMDDREGVWVDLLDLDRSVRGADRAIFFSDEEFYAAQLERFENKARLKTFAQLVAKTISDPMFRQAQRMYDSNFGLRPRPDAHRFLQRLQTSGFSYYLVTEGLTQVQLEKISLSGLHEQFKDRVLVTQAFADTAESRDIVKAAHALDGNPSRLLADDQRSLDYLTLSYFSSMMRRWADKSNKQFYARILHAVQINPDSPQQSANRVEVLNRAEWYRRPPIKLAMIGDRYDKDILPLLELCGKENAITIRIRQGKYQDVPHPLQSVTWRSPTASFDEFAQVGDFIFDSRNWAAIAPVPWPKIFDEPPSVRSAIYVDWAKKRLDSSVQKLAEILENEQRPLVS